MIAIKNAEEGFIRTMETLKLLFGLEPHRQQPFMKFIQFGFHGYTIRVFQSHIDYLDSLNLALVPDLPAFDRDAINRWKLVNELLLTGFTTPPSGASQLSDQFPALATLAAFPTLEEVARRLCNRWDEEGKLLADVPVSDGVVTWKPDGTKKPKPYKAGQRIVALSDKLQLMDLSLDPRLRKTVASLDAVLQRPTIVGVEQPMSPLYARLQFFRDNWVHGRRFEGWEALLISLFMALIYFGSQRLGQAGDDSLGN